MAMFRRMRLMEQSAKQSSYRRDMASEVPRINTEHRGKFLLLACPDDL
jgi:hypothetical protein